MLTNSLKSTQRQCGFSMIEVLVSVVVLSVGLLGLAGLQAASLKANAGAYERSQASVLAQDMLDRMQSNFVGVQTGQYNDMKYLANTPPTAPSCYDAVNNTTPCTNAADLAQLDAFQWANELALKLPSGTGLVTNGKDTGVNGDNSQYIVLVSWDDRSGTGNNSTNVCAAGASTVLNAAIKDKINASEISGSRYCLIVNSQF